MAGGGKGGSQTTEVKIPDWLQNAAQGNIARAGQIAQTGYVPYYGPDVASLTPQQQAQMGNTNSAAAAFGLQGGGDPTAGMPQVQTGADGVQGYSSGSIYDQALAMLKQKAPGLFNAVSGETINPVTGAAPTNPVFAGNGGQVPRRSMGDGKTPIYGTRVVNVGSDRHQVEQPYIIGYR